MIASAAALLVLGGAGAASAGWWLAGRSDGGTIPVASTSLAHLDEQAACTLLVPALQAAVGEVAAFGSVETRADVNWNRVRTAIVDLETIMDVAPPAMRADIEVQLATLRAMEKAHAAGYGESLALSQFRRFSDTGQSLGAVCLAHAS